MASRAAFYREWNEGKTAKADMLTILVADRSPAIRNQFQRRAGQGNPFALVEAEEIGACNKLLEQGGIDLAFVDIGLFGAGESEEFAASIARRKNLVALMADPDREGIFAFAENLKAFDFLIKPFSPEDVDAVIANCRRLSAPIKALIVDPAPSVRKVIGKVLTDSIYRVDIEEAETDAAALDLCARKRFDLVFLDCAVQDMTGLETLQRLIERSPATRVVMMSVERNRWQEMLGFRRGAAAFLHKPFYPIDIEVILHRLFVLDIAQMNGEAGSTVADFDVRIAGRTVSAEHRGDGHVYRFLWFRDPPYLRSAFVKEKGAAAGPAGSLRAEAERAAVTELHRAALLHPPLLESLAG